MALKASPAYLYLKQQFVSLSHASEEARAAVLEREMRHGAGNSCAADCSHSSTPVLSVAAAAALLCYLQD